MQRPFLNPIAIGLRVLLKHMLASKMALVSVGLPGMSGFMDG